MVSTEPINNGRATWIRTREWRHQKPLPYRLAIDLQCSIYRDLIMVRKERLELSHLAAPEPKSGASTNSATSASIYIHIANWYKRYEVVSSASESRIRDNRQGIKRWSLPNLSIMAGCWEPSQGQ